MKWLAGQQESKVESLESIHAARLRSGSEAGTSAPQLQQPAVPPQASSAAITADDDEEEDEADIGPVNGTAGEEDVELDPYMLPVSHEVALEGIHSLFIASASWSALHVACNHLPLFLAAS